MRIDDAWARRIGQLTLGAFVLGPVSAFGWVFAGRSGAGGPGWAWVAWAFGIPLASVLVAFVAMAAHQAGSNLTEEDLAAWERRGEGRPPKGVRRLGGGTGPAFLVLLPFVYLLAGPNQRRLGRYERRRSRRR
jgi:hypothetical protein